MIHYADSKEHHWMNAFFFILRIMTELNKFFGLYLLKSFSNDVHK
jgi:hypothetical protein